MDGARVTIVMTERSLHQCHKHGCDAQVDWSVDLTFLSRGLGAFRRRISCNSTVKVCGAHTQHAMEFILSPINRERITRWMKAENYPPPDFETAEFEFKRLDHDEITRRFRDSLMAQREDQENHAA